MILPIARNSPCPCRSGRKFKRCCQHALENPAALARRHNAVGSRIQAWASQHYHEQVAAAFQEVVDGRDVNVLRDADLQLIGTWALNERKLPDGSTLAQRYAETEDISGQERDIAARIAAARLTLLRVDRVVPDRLIDVYDLTLAQKLAICSHAVSRSVKPTQVIVGRLMAGPPALTLWGPVAVLDRVSGPKLSELLTARMLSLQLEHEPAGLATAVRAASREITSLLTPALRESPQVCRTA